MRFLVISLIIGSLVIIPVTEASALTIKQILCYKDSTLCPNGNVTLAFNVKNGTVSTLNLIGCANNQIMKWQSSNSSWVCGADLTGGGLTTVNGDITAAQILAGTANNVTEADVGPTHTFNLGSNVVTTGLASQTFTKAITFSSGSVLTMTPSSSTGTFVLGTLSAYPTSPRQGILVINGSNLSYNDNTNHTRTVALLNVTQTFFGKKTFTPTSTTAGINMGSLSADPTSPRQADLWIDGANLDFNDNSNRTHAIPNLNTTNNWTNKNDFGNTNTKSQNDTFSWAGIMTRNLAGTFGTQFVNTAQTANHTITIPIINSGEKGNVTLSFVPHYNFTTPANKTGISSVQPLMLGGYATLTTKWATNATVIAKYSIYSNVASTNCVVGIRTSTSYLGPNGGALLGTLLGSNTMNTMSANLANQTVTNVAVATGLTTGTKNFFDLSVSSTVSTAFCKIHHLNWLIKEGE